MTAKLWEVIERLGRMGVVVEHTDHLSDRQLYAHLWHVSLREEVPDVDPEEDDGVWHVDILGGGGAEDALLYLRYYADDLTRAAWAGDFPEFVVPQREAPPCRREEQLQQLYARLDAEGVPRALGVARWRHESRAIESVFCADGVSGRNRRRRAFC